MTALESDRDGIDAVRADGGLVHIRSVAPSDLDGLRTLHARSSDRSMYLRFFSARRVAAEAGGGVLLGITCDETSAGPTPKSPARARLRCSTAIARADRRQLRGPGRPPDIG